MPETPSPPRAADLVVDASAVVAALAGGPLGARAAAAMPRALLSAVGLAEVAALLAARGLGAEDAAAVLDSFECEIVPFDATAARLAAYLPGADGLPLGARATLAVAIARDLPVLTADPRWAKLALGPRIHLLR
jgi:ribonuclease VapC